VVEWQTRRTQNAVP